MGTFAGLVSHCHSLSGQEMQLSSPDGVLLHMSHDILGMCGTDDTVP